MSAETVRCATCGGTAERTTDPDVELVGYRCRDCHAGGHIVGKRHAGGVFERLPNYSTRRVRESDTAERRVSA